MSDAIGRPPSPLSNGGPANVGVSGHRAGPAPAQRVRLEVRDLEIRLADGGPDVVSEVSFAVPAGHILGLVGESGSGKTTVALALLGHARRGLEITRGSVLLDGRDLLTLSRHELQEVRGGEVAYVPQDPSAALNPTLRIGSQLREALKAHETDEDPLARIAEVLSESHLDSSPEMLRRYPHQLSGGQQQRVAIAMAFACRPSVIVLDEPTTGLDVTTQRHVLDTVRTLCRSYGVAAVYVSHDLAVVGGLATEVAVMYAGRIIELGSTARVFGLPLHPYSSGLLAAVPSPERAEVLSGIDGQPPRPGRRPKGCSFAPRCSFVEEACRSVAPPPEEVSGRLVRCLRAAEIEDRARALPALLTHRTPYEVVPAPVLSLRGVCGRYGSTSVLFDVDVDVMPESCVAIVGESGSGKTTLARCIVGLHENWTGEISFGGDALAAGARRRPKELLQRVQYVFQNPYTSLNPRKTIGQIIAQPLEHFFDLSLGERSDRVCQILEDVSLGQDFMSRYPDQLSGGERQRVAIARALVVEPELLVCDEVTSALDVSVQAIIVELLRRLQREHQLAMIFITHNLALVRSIAQDAVVLCEGRMVETGPVDEILEHPKQDYTIRLMEDVPKLAVAGADSGAGRAEPQPV